MPQMKPMNWLNLFIIMNLMIKFLMVIIFFKKKMLNKKKIIYSENMKNKNWKW